MALKPTRFRYAPAVGLALRWAYKLEAALFREYGYSMNATLEEITREALLLTPAQRAELADFLVESLDLTLPDEVQRLWIEEANRRLEEVRSGKVKAIPGEDVLAEARRLAKR
ncbi:MAG: addiction module protein [Pseudomonadota bacterium]